MTLPERKNIRLQSWDYSAKGYYHVTICVKDMVPLFGQVVDSNGVAFTRSNRLTGQSLNNCSVHLSEEGIACRIALQTALSKYPSFKVDSYVIMPNHVHLLVHIENDNAKPLGQFVRCFKSETTKAIRKIIPGCVVWQSRYYDHVIRDEKDYQKTLEYIANNPMKWADDRYFV